MRDNARNLDAGVRDVVTLLNHIPGVTTRASCEGMGAQPARHAHAALAYVAFRHPLPLQLRDFLISRLGALARIEDDGIYCRWPRENQTFVGSLESATRQFLSGAARRSCRSVRWPLARLRARLARQVAHGHAREIQFCRTCMVLVAEAHPEEHRPITLLRLPPDLDDRWFAEFVAQPSNRLDPGLVATAGWVRLLARTQRGDFGVTYRRRWLRYRAQRIADLTTRQIRCGVDAARQQGIPLDFFFDNTHAVFVWEHDRGARRAPP
ncbi:MAG TPA: hypothetical protein VMW56_00185 [Candidatus Margulisiibacteriota bacterium]|nr:hypothetical protein [Candidatus Margulisiibacteriota bacterium]